MTVTQCPVCSAPAAPTLVGRADYEYDIPRRLDYFRCAASACGHVFVAPMPPPEVIASFYASYTTHTVYEPSLLGRAVAWLDRRLSEARVERLFRAIPAHSPLRVLDFGCGNGSFLQMIKARGDVEVTGFDFDPKAVECARALGIACFDNFADAAAHGPFDVIFLNHVIEHLPAPREVLDTVAACLARDGLLEIRTPNASSFLADTCKETWRGWETPRHLNIFTQRSADRFFGSLPGLERRELATSNKMLIPVALASVPEKMRRPRFVRHAVAGLLIVTGLLRHMVGGCSGEEIRVTLARHG